MPSWLPGRCATPAACRSPSSSGRPEANRCSSGIVPDDPEALRRRARACDGRCRSDRDHRWFVGRHARRDGNGRGVARRAGDLLPRPCVAAGQAHSARRVRRAFRSSGSPATHDRPSWCSVSSGSPLVRLVGGWEAPVPEPVVRARLSRDLPSVAGRIGHRPGAAPATGSPNPSSASPRCFRCWSRRTASSRCRSPRPGSTRDPKSR